jgi:hypothetical protein
MVVVSLERIEKKLATQQESTIEGCLSKLEAQMLDICRMISDKYSAESTVEAVLNQIEKRLDHVDVSKELVALDSGLRSVEKRMDYMIGEQFRNEQQDKAGLQSILKQIETSLDLSQEHIVDPLVQRLENQLQAHQEKSVDTLIARIEQRLDTKKERSELERLVAKYEERLQMEMDREMATMHSLSAKLDQGASFPPSPSYPQTGSPGSASAPPGSSTPPRAVRGLPPYTAGGATGGTVE